MSPSEAQPAVRSILRALALAVGATAVAWAMDGAYSLASQVMAYLLAVVYSAFRHGRLDAILTAFLSVAALNFFFVPPRYTFSVENSDYGFTLLALLVVSLVVSGLASSLRGRTLQAQRRERRARELHGLATLLADPRGSVLASRALEAVDSAFGGGALQLPRPEGGLSAAAGSQPVDESASRWVFDNHCAAGAATPYWPELPRTYVPIPGNGAALGVVSVPGPQGDASARAEALEHLEAFARQIGLALQREQLERQARDAALEARAESLRNALLASISHDMRTPLAAILGAASTLSGQRERLADDQQRDLLRSIEDEARQMTATAENILQLARLTAEGASLRKDWESIGEIVGTVVGRLRRRGETRIAVRIGDALPLVEVDAVLIEQLLANLLDNALRHAPGSAAVEVIVTSVEDHIAVSVEDRGPGLGSGDPIRLFAKFQRGANAVAQGGAGLGLAICKAIVDLHGGTIDASNREGGGASIRFALPRRGEPPGIDKTEPLQ